MFLISTVMLWTLLPKYWKRKTRFFSKNASIETRSNVRCLEAFKAQLQSIPWSSASDLGSVLPPLSREVIALNNRIGGNASVCCGKLSHKRPHNIFQSFTRMFATMVKIWLLLAHHAGACRMWVDNSSRYQNFYHPTQQMGKAAIFEWIFLFTQYNPNFSIHPLLLGYS